MSIEATDSHRVAASALANQLAFGERFIDPDQVFEVAEHTVHCGLVEDVTAVPRFEDAVAGVHHQIERPRGLAATLIRAASAASESPMRFPIMEE